jgi:hypothetical protein
MIGVRVRFQYPLDRSSRGLGSREYRLRRPGRGFAAILVVVEHGIHDGDALRAGSMTR